MRTPDLPAGGRRSGAAIVAALSVAAVVVGIAAISLPGPTSRPEPRAATPASATTGSRSVIEVDQGPSADPAEVDACAGEGFVDDPAEADVLYDVVQLAPAGTTPVLLLRNPDGDLRMCDLAGGDGPAVLPLPVPSDQEPVVFLTNGTQARDCDGTVLSGFRATTWLGVHPNVARVEQRYVVDGAPGPWFSSAATDGIAHLQTWLGPQHDGVEIVSEQRVLDADGAVVPQRTWPRRQPLAGCPDGGGADGGADVQIG